MRAAEEHRELLRNLIEGDVAGAMLTMRSHIETGWNELRDTNSETSVHTKTPEKEML